MGLKEIVLILFCTAGFLGSFIPFMPSTPIIFIGALIYGIATGFTVFSTYFMIIIFMLSILAEGADYLMGTVGAKKFGASKKAIIGSLGGLFLGLIFLGPPGIIIGPIIFALAGEIVDGKTPQKALNTILGLIAGTLGGKISKVIISILMIILIISRFR